VALAVFGFIFASSNAQFDQGGGAPAMCGPLTECLVQFEQAAEKDSNITDLLSQAMQNSGAGVGMPKLNKDQFNELCKLFDTLRKCFDDQHAATQCANDPYYKVISGMLRMCQPPNRQVFADNLDCMNQVQNQDSFKQCTNNMTQFVQQAKSSPGTHDANAACSAFNEFLTCTKDPITKQCNAAVYNAMVDMTEPMLEAVPDCKRDTSGGETQTHGVQGTSGGETQTHAMPVGETQTHAMPVGETQTHGVQGASGGETQTHAMPVGHKNSATSCLHSSYIIVFIIAFFLLKPEL